MEERYFSRLASRVYALMRDDGVQGSFLSMAEQEGQERAFEWLIFSAQDLRRI